ncbi:MAG: hypothetical protein OEM52_05470 [bacterium]|nr:hypothetical protein [bacterium]
MYEHQKSSLRFETNVIVSVADTARFLIALDNAYNNLVAFEFLVDRARTKYGEQTSSNRYILTDAIEGKQRRIAPIGRIQDIIAPELRLLVGQVEIHSPGFLEFIGSLNPLEQIRKYMQDRHERKKDIAFRNREEEKRLVLQNVASELEIVQKKVTILKQLNVSDDSIVRILNQHVNQPLNLLGEIQDSGMVEIEPKSTRSDQDVKP